MLIGSASLRVCRPPQTASFLPLMDRFRRYLAAFPQLSSPDVELVLQHMQVRSFRRGEYLLQPGEVCRRGGFLLEGVVRVFHLTETGQDITRYFLHEEDFVVCPDSFHQQIPSLNGLQALTHGVLVEVSHDRYHALFAQVPAWQSVTMRILERALLQIVENRSHLAVEDAATRYERFLAEQPDVARRVPLHCVASYLGIRPASLSRLRRERMHA